ncbi:hypothetical protein SAMN04488082_12243 [Desulfomicrobium apsheronum]|uniref:Uncharacterized protein n=1 Tax=Desulfomicrobium apsheronum TaxID=52560 RepID=A0A1I3Z4C3_9BACT|nr:hypothetical protein SAMN04488082_12243 [Desulfomicrobium apsheronum]
MPGSVRQSKQPDRTNKARRGTAVRFSGEEDLFFLVWMETRANKARCGTAARCHCGLIWCVLGVKKTCFLGLAGEAGLVGPVRPLRNSLAGLVRRNRCVQGVKAEQDERQRFRQRCLARSDSRSNLTGPTRPAAVLWYFFRGKKTRFSWFGWRVGPTKPAAVLRRVITLCHPRAGGDPSFIFPGRYSFAGRSVGCRRPGR